MGEMTGGSREDNRDGRKEAIRNGRHKALIREVRTGSHSNNMAAIRIGSHSNNSNMAAIRSGSNKQTRAIRNGSHSSKETRAIRNGSKPIREANNRVNSQHSGRKSNSQHNGRKQHSWAWCCARKAHWVFALGRKATKLHCRAAVTRMKESSVVGLSVVSRRCL